MSLETLAAAGFALWCWWLGTGVILWLDRLHPSTFNRSLAAWTVLLALSFWGVWQSMSEHSVFSAYLGFGSVIVMWGWHELAFLTGRLTGPRTTPLDAGTTELQRFKQSLDVVIHHELALVLNFGLLCLMQIDQPNHVALCTFALLWCMRVSAKLNLYFGVRHNGAQYLPAHLLYLGSYFRIRSMTPWFVLSMLAACLAWAWMLWRAQQGLVEVTTGWVLLASLLGLAIVEHAMMVLPWPMEKLWGWALSQPGNGKAANAIT
jgi:putative photosynthetic complex assembly protein 2